MTRVPIDERNVYNTSPSNNSVKMAPYLYKEIVQIRDSLNQVNALSVQVGEAIKKDCEEPKTAGEIKMLEEVTNIMISITDLYKELNNMSSCIERSLISASRNK